MDAIELAEWEAFLSWIEPLPETRADLRMGIMVANLLLPHLKRGALPPKPADFMPDFSAELRPPARGQNIETMKHQWEMAVKAFTAAGKGRN